MSNPTMNTALIVVYTERLDECRDWYTGLGLPLVQEKHGNGPVHYAAELGGGLVVEFYPSKPDRVTGRMRLGFTVDSDGYYLPPGDHQFVDPDGRVVVVTVREPSLV